MAFKRIADGFYKDAESLLNEFELEKSCEFKTFAVIWRKKNFSCIYMGRENRKELMDFTNEIFRQSSYFLTYDSIWFQIGGVFLLYALYRNQILLPAVRIRMELKKYEIMKRLFDKAISDKLYSLHFVLEYLFQNTLDLVAFPSLLGPLVNIFDKVLKNEPEKKLDLSDFRCNVEVIQNNRILEDLNDSFLKYGQLTSSLRYSYADNRCKKLISILSKLIADQPNNNNNDGNTCSGIQSLPDCSNNARYGYPLLNSDLKRIDDSSENNMDATICYASDESMERFKDDSKPLVYEEFCHDDVDSFCYNHVRQYKNPSYYQENPSKNELYSKAMSLVEVTMLSDSEDES